MDAAVDTGPVSIPVALACPVLIDECQFLEPDDADRSLGKVKTTTCLLDPFPSWLIKAIRKGLVKWVGGVVNVSLQHGRITPCLKEAIGRQLLKRPSLDPTMLNN